MDFLFQTHQKEKHSSIIHRHEDNLTSSSLLVIPYLNLQWHSNVLRALQWTEDPFIHTQSNDLRKCLWKPKIVLDSCCPSCFYTNCKVSRNTSREKRLSVKQKFLLKTRFRSQIMCDSLDDVWSVCISVWELESIDRVLTHTHARTHTHSTGRRPGNSVAVTCFHPPVSFQATRPDSNTLWICRALWIWL